MLFFLLLYGTVLYFFFNKNSSNQDGSGYSSSKISANISNSETSQNSSNTNENQVNTSDNNNVVNESNQNGKNQILTETIISSFSTPIVDDNKNRVNNIKITCSRINGTIVKEDEEFSFCDVVGQPSAKDGYKEAHAFANGKLINAIGGGNCQVSTTVYNAAKKTDGVEITERHEHGKPVGYIEMGKDATVAYDYYDLKFENHNDYSLKLKAFVKNKKVYVEIYKIA